MEWHRSALRLLTIIVMTWSSVAYGILIPRQDYTNDVGKPISKTTLKMMQASSQDIGWRFLQTGAALDITEATSVTFRYVPPTLAWESTVTGAVELATNGTVLIRFRPADLATNTLNGAFSWRMDVKSSSNTLAYAYGDMEVVADQWTTVTQDINIVLSTTRTNLDWSLYTNYVAGATNGPYRAGTYLYTTTNNDGSINLHVSPQSILVPGISNEMIAAYTFLNAESNNLYAGMSNALWASQQVVLVQARTDEYETAYSYSTNSTNSITQWAVYKAVQHVNMNAKAITNFSYLWASNDGRVAVGYGMHPDNMESTTAQGAIQAGYNEGTLTIGTGSRGASQHGWNEGTMTIGNWCLGASQHARNENVLGTSVMTIGADANGALQRLYNTDATAAIGATASGASQFGQLYKDAGATNNGIGAMQLFVLTNNQYAITTSGGSPSFLMGGNCTASNKNSMVVGDGNVSHGDSTITCGKGFWVSNNVVITQVVLNGMSGTVTGQTFYLTIGTSNWESAYSYSTNSTNSVSQWWTYVVTNLATSAVGQASGQIYRSGTNLCIVP